MTWQDALSQAITDIHTLYAQLGITAQLTREVIDACRDFPLRVPQTFLNRMTPGDPNDPLLLQVLPRGAERLQMPGYSLDPLKERDANPVPGVLHKYAGRVLLTAAGACAVNCRYCFRRHFAYRENVFSSEALAYVQSDTTLNEVILSGGDPLMLKDTRLMQLVQQLESIAHIETLRIHTRFPIVVPSRITQALCDMLERSRLSVVMVLHVNHANEIDGSVAQAMSALRRASVTLLNQCVLLKGVNDSVDALSALSRRLWSVGILPYYCHLLDPVQGVGHFDVPEETAKVLFQSLVKRLPGYLVPKLTREVAGAESKMAIPYK